jgi:hypothetical protein
VADAPLHLKVEVVDVLRRLDGEFVTLPKLLPEVREPVACERICLRPLRVVRREEAGDEVRLVQVYPDVSHGL